jgi:hypothetical protein
VLAEPGVWFISNMRAERENAFPDGSTQPGTH